MDLHNNIPTLLKQHPNWVAWGIRDAPLKAPFNPTSLLSGRPTPAKAGIRETWGSYESAVECVRRGLAQGIGYEFDGRVCGIDLDHVINENGTLMPQAQDIVGKLNSYTEVSPSGTGLHIFVFAPDADITHHRKKNFFLEIYSTGRYFTVTGNMYSENRDIAFRASELQAVHDKYLLPPVPQRSALHSLNHTPISKSELNHTPISITETATDKWRFLHIGLRRDNVLAALWNGERRTTNESANDIALMNKLAYWCNADPDTMVRAFFSSPFFAQKDEPHKKKCHRPDYLPNTARASCNTVYSTAIIDYARWQENRNRKGLKRCNRTF